MKPLFDFSGLVNGRLVTDDVIQGTGGDDTLIGTSGADTIQGAKGDDDIRGMKGDDSLGGGQGDDTLAGGKGDDTLHGGIGSDRLIGGNGADLFSFTSLTDSTVSVDGRDTVADFHHGQGDVIDLSLIDADATADGDQAFHLVASFSGAVGELELVLAGGKTLLLGDVDGDAVADLVIKLSGDQTAFTGFVL